MNYLHSYIYTHFFSRLPYICIFSLVSGIYAFFLVCVKYIYIYIRFFFSRLPYICIFSHVSGIYAFFLVCVNSLRPIFRFKKKKRPFFILQIDSFKGISYSDWFLNKGILKGFCVLKNHFFYAVFLENTYKMITFI